jgi:glutamyl-tRNA synthetase
MVLMENLREEILRWALVNAREHGSADASAVIKRILAEHPSLRSRVREILEAVREVVAQVNSMTVEERERRLSEVGLPEKRGEERRQGLPDLPGARQGYVVTRFAPNPNGPLHLGNARAAILSHEYARRYGGRFILRFEDTNPEKVQLEMYDYIKRDLRWLGLKWDEEHVQSERLPIYYEYAERLIAEGRAYVCACRPEDFKRLREDGEPCPCRGRGPDENLRMWERMIAGDLGEGEAVLRIKTDLGHPNPAVRDWPACRIVETPHPRAGERWRVWPLYNFAAAIDDHEMGVTHIFRGKEHEVNEQCQKTLYEHLGWTYPVAVQYGRLNMPGVMLSKTQIVRAVKEGEISGYDDVRLATLAALRRRGFLPEAIKRVILDVGLTLVDSQLSWETICAANRKLVDAIADRYFFVSRPVRLTVSSAPPLAEVRLRLHPSREEAGERIVPLRREGGNLVFFIEESDVAGIREGEVFRLKDLMNVRLVRRETSGLIGDFAGMEVAEVPKIHWVPAGAVEMDVLMPDGSTLSGLAEPAVLSVAPGSVIQFERFGFVRVERLSPRPLAVFTHR